MIQEIRYQGSMWGEISRSEENGGRWYQGGHRCLQPGTKDERKNASYSTRRLEVLRNLIPLKNNSYHKSKQKPQRSYYSTKSGNVLILGIYDRIE